METETPKPTIQRKFEVTLLLVRLNEKEVQFKGKGIELDPDLNLVAPIVPSQQTMMLGDYLSSVLMFNMHPDSPKWNRGTADDIAPESREPMPEEDHHPPEPGEPMAYHSVSVMVDVTDEGVSMNCSGFCVWPTGILLGDGSPSRKIKNLEDFECTSLILDFLRNQALAESMRHDPVAQQPQIDPSRMNGFLMNKGEIHA